jgi:hypothetical protein
METTDIKLDAADRAEIPAAETAAAEIVAAEIPVGEIGHSLLALIQAHTEPENSPPEAPAQRLAAGLNDGLNELATSLELTAQQREQARGEGYGQSLRIAEMYIAIAELLELMHSRMVSAPLPEIEDRIEASEERQRSMIESTLKHWESERKSQEAEHLLHLETLQIQGQIEVNRLLRVMWLGTGLAAAGAGAALLLLRN